MQESKIEQASSSKIQNSEDKITINNSADLYKIPISVLKKTKVYNFQGKYYDKIYNEALDIEKEKIRNKPPKQRTIPSYKTLQPEQPKISPSEINKTEYDNKTITENKNITNNNIIKVIFKFPDGKNKIEKKFLKTEKIQNLYDFINTINLNIKYDLISIFPYKQFKDYNKTLEEEELYPSCVIQIRSLENVEKKD